MNFKTFFSFVIFVVIEVSVVFAGPFGLEMGMTLEEVKEACSSYIYSISSVKDMYEIYPEKAHSSFDKYYAYIDEKYGLYAVMAVTESIASDDYGTEVKERFYGIVASLSGKYGNPYVIDEIVDTSSYYTKDNDWVTAMRDGARKLEAYWEKSRDGVKHLDNISSIKLITSCTYSKKEIALGYVFSNNNERLAEENSYL